MACDGDNDGDDVGGDDGSNDEDEDDEDDGACDDDDDVDDDDDDNGNHDGDHTKDDDYDSLQLADLELEVVAGSAARVDPIDAHTNLLSLLISGALLPYELCSCV